MFRNNKSLSDVVRAGKAEMEIVDYWNIIYFYKASPRVLKAQVLDSSANTRLKRMEIQWGMKNIGQQQIPESVHPENERTIELRCQGLVGCQELRIEVELKNRVIANRGHGNISKPLKDNQPLDDYEEKKFERNSRVLEILNCTSFLAFQLQTGVKSTVIRVTMNRVRS